MAHISEDLATSLQHLEPATSVEESLARLLKARAEEKQHSYQRLVEAYQQQYGMDAETFYSTCIATRDHSWKEEETYFDWVTARQMVAEMKEEITRLKEILSRTKC
jgi:septation ring formation regulator EzrA